VDIKDTRDLLIWRNLGPHCHGISLQRNGKIVNIYQVDIS
jgi:hypothetical protein